MTRSVWGMRKTAKLKTKEVYMGGKKMRKRIFSGKPAQFRYLVLLLVSMLAPLLIVGGCLYYLIFMVMADQLGIPESIAINLFPVIQKINIIIVLGMPPIIIAMILWGAFLSHRFVGPLERLENELDRIARSADYSRRIVLRKTDDLKPIADKINGLLDAVQRKPHGHK